MNKKIEKIKSFVTRNFGEKYTLIIWCLGVLLVLTFFFLMEAYDARPRPGQPSDSVMKETFSKITYPEEHKILGPISGLVRAGTVSYSQKFETAESAEKVSLYFTENLEKEGWRLVVSKRSLTGYNLKFCKENISTIINVSGLDQSSVYEIRVAWAYFQGNYAYCDSSRKN